MSKIICDVCGTSYAETASHCPICGCVRAGEAKPVVKDTKTAAPTIAENYQYVKGGRFSKSNVKKRNKANQQSTPPAEKPRDDNKGSKWAALVALIVLLALIAVVVYIAIKVFMFGLIPSGPAEPSDTANPGWSETDPTPPPTTLPSVTQVPCDGLVLSIDQIELKQEKEGYLLSVTKSPANTTDAVTFTSSNPTVATVSAKGKIEAVGPGETTITVTCGTQQVTCTVICTFGPDVTDPTAPPTEPPVVLELNRFDITFSSVGSGWQLYTGDIPLKDIKFTSRDEDIATFKNGYVKAVGRGTTTVYAEYQGQVDSCIIRCNWTETPKPTEPDTTVPDATGPDPTQPSTNGPYTIRNNYGLETFDSTIKVGESFSLLVFDGKNLPVDVTWTSKNTNVCTVSNGNSIKGVARGTTEVTVVIEGVTYRWIVRVTD